MLINTGVPTAGDIEKIQPSKKSLEKKALAIIECFQNIPCNPCVTSCPTHAITMEDINDLPHIDEDKCTGCSICLSVCPGLAIFIIDETYSDTEAIVKIPYEFLPLPQINKEVELTDREGNVVGKGKVIKIQNLNKEKRKVISLVVPKKLSMVVRGFKVG